MYYNKTCNGSIKGEINSQTSLHCTPTRTKSKTESKTNAVNNCTDTVQQNEVSGVETYLWTAATSCTSSTDSGVNVSDNDEIPSHSPSLTPSSNVLYSYESTAAVRQCYEHFSKKSKNIINRDNNVNNYKHNNFKIINNNNIQNSKFNGDNDVVHDDDINNVKCEKFGNKLKVEDTCSEGYQAKTENTFESEDIINNSQQQNLITLTPTETVIKNYNKLSSQHDDFFNLQQRPASMSSIANSNGGEILAANMYHCNGSPVVSIRSISSTIISSDSEEDSDLNSDIEGGQENYVIKKLGTQVTYSANDPGIPRINSGHTVLNQKVIPNVNELVLPPLEAIAAIGDSIGAAQALGAVPSISAIAQRPQIGSIALNNSSDVTFGDKHFYEGPVTIQQFLIDSRDKSKETNTEDNPSFAKQTVGASSNNAKEPDPSAEKSRKLYEYILKRKKLIIPGVLAFVALLIVATILATLNESKSKLVLGNSEESRDIIPINSTIGQDNIGGGYVLRIVPRNGWLAQPPINPWVKLKLPVGRVIVIATKTSECETQAACTYTVRITQTYNIESQQQDDIIYNFLIGGDGNVYEGRGWDNRGSVIKGFNDDSISFAYIGLFNKQPPSYKQLNVTELLLQEGIRLKKLSPNYRLVGANKLDPTSLATSADALYKSFENLPHWSDE